MDHGKSQDRTNADISLLTDPDALGVMFGAITALATQGFFACRCYRLFFSRKWRYSFALVISTLIGIGFIAQWGIAIVECKLRADKYTPAYSRAKCSAVFSFSFPSLTHSSNSRKSWSN